MFSPTGHWMQYQPLLTFVLALAVTLLTGCSAIRQTMQNQPCSLHASQPYDTVHINPARHDVTLHWKNPATGQLFKTISNVVKWLEERGDSVIAVTNAGIFEPGLIPTGLHAEHGQELHPLNLADGYGNFYLKPNGVFLVHRDRFSILESARFATEMPPFTHALQSGPLLLQDGQIHPSFTPGSRNCRLRSGIGVSSDGHAVIAISNGAVNFFDFAIWFRNVAGVTDALYLDGAISTLHTGKNPGNRNEKYAGFLAVTAKK